MGFSLRMLVAEERCTTAQGDIVKEAPHLNEK